MEILKLKSYYEALRGSRGVSFPWLSIRGVKVSHKLAFFTWTEAQCKILTVDNLQK